MRTTRFLDRYGGRWTSGAAAWFPATGATARTGGFQALDGALADEIRQHLVHRADDMEQEPTGWGGGVDALLEHDQVHLAFGERRGDLGEVADRAGHPGQAGDDEFVAGSKVVQALVPFQTAREPPGGGVGPIRWQPAARSASSWESSVCDLVETRA
ncbi:MAG TPA: hypothetical protein VGL46_10410 [Pseudonocardiaceae bacterium]|jgi:hypothetical protein